MKKKTSVTALIICAVMRLFSLCACADKVEIVADDNPYTFVNKEHDTPETDADMMIDGKLDEARWQNSRWLEVCDKPNAQMYADIAFTTSYGEKGIYFGMKVQEHGTYIYCNPERASSINSSIEMYAAPIKPDGTSARNQVIQFNFQSDGTIANWVNTAASGAAQWLNKLTVWEKMPVSAATYIGGELNNGATGYIIEAYVPFTFFEFCGWEISDPDSLVMGIDPAHNFSYNYSGKDSANDRFWSCWSRQQGFISTAWLDATTFFRFNGSGLMAYDLDVTNEGEGSGSVTANKALPILAGVDNTILIKPYNNYNLTKFEINGENKFDELIKNGGYFSYNLGKVEGKNIINEETNAVEITVKFE